ncbi:chromatin remodeling complex subunit [Grosmannia clavigera kw1407]|uniref:Chromatin remodeling complex subunit n=1 Tax=Grosmannia clavigera (strain kw1407 / UAMH 11150) TaxID=655863 RepID=F0XQ80_GROCL|nr:chromatin remodeling complex subunit [Grosmannia clavigera kw1407]EFX00117.1 chromatin remodeling complex subunit [Grosmannia clavigera kw1407]
MVGKVSERVLLREGLERTDNGMKQTSWPEVTPINQKNYYTEYMKRDDQILALRMQNDATQPRRDAASAPGTAGGRLFPLPTDGIDISKIIVIHPGSQYLRIGFSTDVLPKTVPMCLATQFDHTESDEAEALPRRQREAAKTEQQYGEEWSKKYKKMSEDLKQDMRQNKRKVLPNSKELVINYNRRTEAEVIATHNDPLQVEWTDVNAIRTPALLEGGAAETVTATDTETTATKTGAPASSPPSAPTAFYGQEALRIPDDSNPTFRLRWPMQHGWLNEDDYGSVSSLYSDFEAIVTHAILQELGLQRVSSCRQYSCVFVVPDLYDKAYVEMLLRLCMTWFEFGKVCFIQESYAATCGAGYSQGCVVDVGAQKTSVACVEDGLVVEESRVNVKYGGRDVTEAFVKMLLFDHFPYQDINLRRRYDFLLAEELKLKHCTMNEADVSVQLYQFHLRAPHQPTYRYQFKTYDEVLLAPLGLYEPAIFDSSTKLRGRRKLIDRTYNAYDVDIPDDPVSSAQVAILALDHPSVLPPALATNGPRFGTPGPGGTGADAISTPSKDRTQPFSFLSRDLAGGGGATPSTSKAPSPAPEGTSTPVPAPYVFGAGRDTVNNGAASPAPSGSAAATSTPATGGAPGTATATATVGAPAPGLNGLNGLFPMDPLFHRTAKEIAAERDSVLPVAPLDIAIMTSIQNAAKGDERKLKDFLGSIMVVGGGAKTPHFTTYLEERLKARRADLVDRILVSRSARDMDEQVVVWKGASVFAKLTTNDSWITPFEYSFLGPRILHHKVLWQW